MRLVNTKDLTFTEFLDPESTPAYAILSHRWTTDEICYKDFRKRSRAVKKTSGYRKVAKFCDTVRAYGHRWAWVDTICIDRRSSAELSEAINSMFTWYENAQICVVYLHDYPGTRGTPVMDKAILARCEWFTRGWTLQELLAPQCVEFRNADWQVIGHKGTEAATSMPWSWSDSDSSQRKCNCSIRRCRHLNDDLESITGISGEYFRQSIPTRKAAVAVRMSWAARRVTTRPEDIAYCLLGLLDVTMPLLYGEGTRAFRRLQEQLVGSSSDDSVFAWGTIDCLGRAGRSGDLRQGLFATSPADFADCGKITVPGEAGLLTRQDTYNVANRWIHVYRSLEVLPSHSWTRVERDRASSASYTDRMVLFLRLRCLREGTLDNLYIALVPFGNDESGASLCRASQNDLLSCPELASCHDLGVIDRPRLMAGFASTRRDALHDRDYYIDTHPPDTHNEARDTMFGPWDRSRARRAAKDT